MLRWKIGSAFKYGAHAVEKRIDAVKRGIKTRFDLFDPVCIMPYHGYGNDRQWYLKGRVVEELGVPEPTADASWWQNARAMSRRFTSDEIPFVRLRARFGEQSWECKTDDEGYFEFSIDPGKFDESRLWHDIDLKLLDQVVKGQGDVESIGQVAVPAADSSFGVISDIDDTIVHSHATDTLRLVRMTLMGNSRTRVALPGVPAFYRALQRGDDGDSTNPFFYVSSSAWNLHDALEDFINYHDIPRGPILLRDLGIDKTKFIKTGHEHKLEKIRRILEVCHSLPFLLIGDAGQHDPQLYRQVVKEFPGRVKGIYIREVGWKDRSQEVSQIAKEVAELDSAAELRLVRGTVPAAEHAAARGWIDSSAIDEIRRQVEVDE